MNFLKNNWNSRVSIHLNGTQYLQVESGNSKIGLRKLTYGAGLTAPTLFHKRGNLKSWKIAGTDDALRHTRLTTHKIRDFGDSWAISHGLRFGEPVLTRGTNEYGEAREIWSPISKEVIDLWERYLTFREGVGLEEAYLTPDFIQIDDREWSLGFIADKKFELDRIKDICFYLAEIGLRSRNLYFDIWAESTEGLDFQICNRVGITKQSEFSDCNAFTYSALSSPPTRDTPLAHGRDGEIVHLKKVAFEICKFCNFSGVVWCNKQQEAVLDKYQDGDSRGFLEHFTAWDYVTFALGFHQHCIKENLSNEKIEGLFLAALKDLT